MLIRWHRSELPTKTTKKVKPSFRQYIPASVPWLTFNKEHGLLMSPHEQHFWPFQQLTYCINITSKFIVGLQSGLHSSQERVYVLTGKIYCDTEAVVVSAVSSICMTKETKTFCFSIVARWHWSSPFGIATRSHSPGATFSWPWSWCQSSFTRRSRASSSGSKIWTFAHRWVIARQR